LNLEFKIIFIISYYLDLYQLNTDLTWFGSTCVQSILISSQPNST